MTLPPHTHTHREMLLARDESGADLAEWFPLKDPREPIEPGDVVELFGAGISCVISGRGQIFVVTTHPWFVANRPLEKSDDEVIFSA